MIWDMKSEILGRQHKIKHIVSERRVLPCCYVLFIAFINE